MRLRDLRRTELGLHPAATTRSKNSIYSMGEHPQEIRVLAQENDLYWIDKADGVEVVGSPVGSLQYQIEFVNKQGDKIIDEPNLVEKLVTAAPSSREGRVQLCAEDDSPPTHLQS